MDDRGTSNATAVESMTEPVTRKCSECANEVTGKRLTCSPKCRSARSRRMRRTSQHSDIADAVYQRKTDVTREIVKEELRPVVRAAITEEVLRSIQDLVGLAPRVVELLAQDLESSDPSVRQKAYSLIAKYTLGHTAIVTPEDQGTGQLVVNFNMPRPDGEEPEYDVNAEATEIVEQECAFCNETKPLSEFVAGSERCRDCHNRLKLEAEKLLHD